MKEHINAFPRMPSHYCRSRTQREYLESHLNVTTMYKMYRAFSADKKEGPVSESIYRKTFLTEFNIVFFVPRGDRCDLCEEHRVATEVNKIELPVDRVAKVLEHKRLSGNCTEERKRDRAKNIPVICFDLENVFALPRGDVSCYFYKRKLNCFNMTAILSATKDVYCVILTRACLVVQGTRWQMQLS